MSKAILIISLSVAYVLGVAWSFREIESYIKQNTMVHKPEVVEQVQPPVYIKYSEYIKKPVPVEAKAGQITIGGEVPAQTLIIEGEQ